MRHAKPWFRKSTGKWYVEIGGRQVPLGRHPEKAPLPKRGKEGWNAPELILSAFHRLMVNGVTQAIPTHLEHFQNPYCAMG